MSDTPIYDYIHKVLRCNCYLSDLGGIECNNCKAKRDLFDLERRNAELTARIAELEASCETWKETAEAVEESARNLATFANDDNCFNLPMGGASITARDAIRRLRNDLCDAAEHLNAVYKQRDEAEKKAKERFDQIDALTFALTEARKDGQRLDWLDTAGDHIYGQQYEGCEDHADGWEFEIGAGSEGSLVVNIYGHGKTIREAIDAAMLPSPKETL